jgi:hypothetical protein
VGIILLNFKTPKIPGDLGNATTWNFPVRYKLLKEAVWKRVIDKADMDLSPYFIEAARELEKEGVRAITTSCGFSIIYQDAISKAVGIPVATSSILQVPLVHKMINKRVGILTADDNSLGPKHLKSAGINPSIPIAIRGLRNHSKEYHRVFFTDPKGTQDINPKMIEREMIENATYLISKYPDIGALVFECVNMPPYAAAVQRVTKLPVFDITTLINYLTSGMMRKEFHGFM